MIRSARTSDAAQIAAIYNHYIKHTVITFDLDPVSEARMASKIESLPDQYPWLVYEYQARITAYAYATAWNARKAYAPTVELSIYADEAFSGRGHGIRLYRQLIAGLRQQGFHSAMAGIALPNDPSVRLHESFGFRKVAHFSEVGHKFDRWIDVGYWQLMFQS